MSKDTNKDTKLLPCPFCGEEADVSYAAYIGGGGFCLIVSCTRCWDKTSYYGTEEEAIKAWNTRAERTCRAVMAASKIASTCSECGSMLANWAMRYCPNCGAKVVEE